MTKIIEVVVHPDGTTRVETKGFDGVSCRDASTFLEQALGQRASEKLTAEYFGHASEHRNVQQEG